MQSTHLSVIYQSGGPISLLTVGTTPTSSFLSRLSRRHARSSSRVCMTAGLRLGPAPLDIVDIVRAAVRLGENRRGRGMGRKLMGKCQTAQDHLHLYGPPTQTFGNSCSCSELDSACRAFERADWLGELLAREGLSFRCYGHADSARYIIKQMCWLHYSLQSALETTGPPPLRWPVTPS
jgi:hypothetical protein